MNGDGGVAEAGGDPQDGLLGGGAGQEPVFQGVQCAGPADEGQRLAGADSRVALAAWLVTRRVQGPVLPAT